LWERLERRFLPMRAYEALVLTRGAYAGEDGGEPSGLQVAIARRADATLASLTPAQQAIARRIFLRLIQFGQGRADTRRQQPIAALRSSGDDIDLFDTTLQRLAASRLLTLSSAAITVQPTNVQTLVDISHEALIRGWPTLQGWLRGQGPGVGAARARQRRPARRRRAAGGRALARKPRRRRDGLRRSAA
jgi:hypothetical protein